MKISFLTIEDKKYPLSFSLYTAQEILKRYKKIDSLMYMLKDKNTSLDRKIDVLSVILSLMIYSGCQYYNAFKMQPYKSAPVDDKGRFIALNEEQIKLSIEPTEDKIKELVNAIESCIEMGKRQEIGTKPIKSNSKKKKKN